MVGTCAITVITMPTKANRPRRLTLIGLGLACGLMALAVPQVIAALSPPASGFSAEGQRAIMARSPGDAYGWARLSYLSLQQNSPLEAAEALALSYRLGPWERPLLTDRLPLAAALWEHLPDAIRTQALGDLVRAWSWQRTDLLTALPPDRYWVLYRRALADDPAALTVVAHRVGLD